MIDQTIPESLRAAIPTSPERARLAANIEQAYIVAKESNRASLFARNPMFGGTTLESHLERNAAIGAIRAIKDNEKITISEHDFPAAVKEWVGEINSEPAYMHIGKGDRGGVYDNPAARHELLERVRSYVATNLQFNSWGMVDLLSGLPDTMKKMGISGWSTNEVIEANLDFLSAVQRTFPDADNTVNGHLTIKTMNALGYSWDYQKQAYKKTSN